MFFRAPSSLNARRHWRENIVNAAETGLSVQDIPLDTVERMGQKSSWFRYILSVSVLLMHPDDLPPSTDRGNQNAQAPVDPKLLSNSQRKLCAMTAGNQQTHVPSLSRFHRVMFLDDRRRGSQRRHGIMSVAK